MDYPTPGAKKRKKMHREKYASYTEDSFADSLQQNFTILREFTGVLNVEGDNTSSSLIKKNLPWSTALLL